MDWTKFLTALGHVSNIVGLATFVVSIFIYLQVQTETQKIKKTIREQIATLPPALDLDQVSNYYDAINTLKPVAWAFSLTPNRGSIASQVKEFLKVKRDITGIAAWEMPVHEIEMERIDETSQGAQDFYNQVRRKKRELEIEGYTEVHLFFSGPVPAALNVGCLLSNWMPVKLYHKPQTNPSYIYWMPLVKI